MAYRLLRRDTTSAWTGVNHKRIQRLWRQEGLRRPARTRKRRRVTPEGPERLRAERPNQVWALDFQFDETTDRRRLKSLHVVDEHTREALAMRVGRTCTSDEVVDVLTDLVAVRGAPEHLRMDNGPEMIAWALRDYCRTAGTRTAFIEPGSPWENPFVESFNSRVRDELFNVEEFATLPRGPSRCRSLADRVQHLPTPLLPRRPHPGRVRGQLDQHHPTSTLIAAGPHQGVPSASCCAWPDSLTL